MSNPAKKRKNITKIVFYLLDNKKFDSLAKIDL